MSAGSYGTLRVNGKERLCELYYHRNNFTASTAAWNITIDSNIIPEAYATAGIVSAGSYHENVMMTYVNGRTLYCSTNKSNITFNIGMMVYSWRY